MTQRMRLVPAYPTPTMKAEGAKGLGSCDISHDIYDRMLAASPNGGCVTDADLERAAREIDPTAWATKADGVTFRNPWMSGDRHRSVRAAHTTARSLGLPFASEPTHSEGEG